MTEPFIVIIAGGRKFSDYDMLKKKCDRILSRITRPIIIRSGTATGADTLGERYADECGYEIQRFPADWNRQRDGSYDKAAGYKRNVEMAVGNDKYPDAATAAIIFWDGVSKGSDHMKNIAKKNDMKLKVIQYEG